MNQTLLWIMVGLGFYMYFVEKFGRNKSSQKKYLEPEKNHDNFDPQNYELRQTLMTPTERMFFEKLKRSIGDKFDIYPQVNLDKIFKTKYQNNKYAFNGAKWAIDRRSIDFLVTLRDTQRPYVGIELDDSSHERPDRLIRDEKVGALFEQNGISLVRFNSTDNFLDAELKKVFDSHY